MHLNALKIFRYLIRVIFLSETPDIWKVWAHLHSFQYLETLRKVRVVNLLMFSCLRRSFFSSNIFSIFFRPMSFQCHFQLANKIMGNKSRLILAKNNNHFSKHFENQNGNYINTPSNYYTLKWSKFRGNGIKKFRGWFLEGGFTEMISRDWFDRSSWNFIIR